MFKARALPVSLAPNIYFIGEECILISIEVTTSRVLALGLLASEIFIPQMT